MEQTHRKPDEEIDILDYLAVILKYRWMIFRNVVVATLLIIVISLFLAKTFTAEATLLPPDENQQGDLLSAIVGTPLSQFGLSQLSSTADLFVQILKSRTVFDSVLKTTFEYKKENKTLLSILKHKSLEKARKDLNKAVTVSTSPEGIISIKVELSTPHLAADVANAFVYELDRINKEKNTSRAKNSRVYIEQQLQLTETKLKEASARLAQFKEEFKAVSLEEQTKTAIEKAGEIKGNIIAKEVQLGVALQTMKSDNVYIIQLKKEIEELNKQYSYLQFGDSLALGEKKEFYIPFSEVPEIGLKLAKLIRDVKIQETVWELLNQQYYHAKIQEARDTPTVQVLDKAVPPEFRTKPKRKLLVLIGGFLAFIFSLFGAFVIEFYAKIKHEQRTVHFAEELKSDVKSIKETIKKRLKISKTDRD